MEELCIMTTIGIRALRAQLTECVRLAAAGKVAYDIACHGKVMARLIGAGHEDATDSGTSAVNVENTSGAKDGVVDQPFEVTRAKSLELKTLAQQRLAELEQLGCDDLLQTFMDATAVLPGHRLSDRELIITMARIYQLNLWVSEIGTVPGDIALRDQEFWLKLLSKCLHP